MSVTAPLGFVASACHAGVKGGGADDLALVAVESGQAVPAAGVFTSNLAAAAPVTVSREHLAVTGGEAAAVILNSGNANAATGKRGIGDARRMCAFVGDALGTRPEQVLVCSTGLIGIPLPIELVNGAIWHLVDGRSHSPEAGSAAARAIMTTDTRPKETIVETGDFVVGGMAKGAGMLAPNMATMLAVLTTDASIGAAELRACLNSAVRRSFNALTVDGCSSTNDTVLVMASGARGPASRGDVTDALTHACEDLALQIAGDAEGATKTVRVRVKGAVSDSEARRAARRVAESMLVKCSLHGGDPYWGRVVSELGSAGVGFDLDRVAVAYGGIEVCREGTAAGHDVRAVRGHMAGPEVIIDCDLGLGEGSGSVLTVDLGHGYIDENVGTS